MNEFVSDEFSVGYKTAIDQVELALEFLHWYCVQVDGKNAPLDKFYKAYQYYVDDTFHQLHIRTLKKQDFLRVLNKIYSVDVNNNTVHDVSLRSVALQILHKNENNDDRDQDKE